MDIKKTIARNLNLWMEGPPELTIKQLAGKSSVGFGTIQRAKNGDGNITVQNLEALACAFGRTATDLLTPPPQGYEQHASADRKITDVARPDYHVDKDIADLISAVTRLTPADARALLPIVTRLADSIAPSTARPNSNNRRVAVDGADNAESATG